MHNAPSVSYPVGRSLWAAVLVFAGWLAGAAAAGWWVLASPAPGWRQGLGVAAVLLAGAWAAWEWRRMPAGELSWDGSRWAWPGAAPAEPLSVEAALDLQHVLLLRWRAPGCSGWLWLERSHRPARWDELRRAVYSRANPDALQRAEPPSATP